MGNPASRAHSKSGSRRLDSPAAPRRIAARTGAKLRISTAASSAFTGSRPGAGIDRLRSPMPTRASASSGLDAASPHSETDTPAALAARNHAFQQVEHRRD